MEMTNFIIIGSQIVEIPPDKIFTLADCICNVIVMVAYLSFSTFVLRWAFDHW